MDKDEKKTREKDSRSRVVVGLLAAGLLTALSTQILNMWLEPRPIVYPVDILVESPAPLYQADFPLEDAIFSSKFESGNLRTVVDEAVYKLEIGEDCTNSTRFNNKNWFYFSIENKGPTRLITVQIDNMAYNWSMWKNGIAPVYRSAHTNWKWAFLDHFPLEMRLKKDSLQVAFKYRLRASEKVFVALSFPWSYSADRHYYAKLEAKHHDSSSIYFEKEVGSSDQILAKSLQGRRVQMITITRKNNSETEKHYFPQLGVKSHLFLGRQKSNTRFFPNKKYIVLSARVHPSEVASSYVLRAFVKHLLKQMDKDAKLYPKLTPRFLENFVIVIIPMLNPDGVANGYTRLDTNGLNLNAYYKFANRKTPTIYALKRLVKYLSDQGVLHAYIDLHAHTTKRGIFFFANPLNEDNYRETLEIPFLFYDYQKQFTFKRDRFGVEKGESTSRKEFYRLTKCNRLYVLETNYWGETATLSQLKARRLVKDNLRFVKNFGRFYTLEKFAQIGTNLAKAIVNAGMIEVFRHNKRYRKQLMAFYREMHEIYRALSSKSQRRKLKKMLKKQSEKFKQNNLFIQGDDSPRGALPASSQVNLHERAGKQLAKRFGNGYVMPDSHNYDEEILLNEEDKLHQEEGFKGQDPVR